MLASVALVVALAYHPVYTMLYRDAAMTTWLNVVAAPIAGTIEDFDLRPGERVASSGEVGRIVKFHSVDRSGVIRAELAARQAAARLAELNAYESRISAMSKEWQDRKGQYADGFRRDLDLKIEELASCVTLLRERVDFADASAKRKQTLRRAGNTSQADEEAAISSHRELQASLSDATLDLQERRVIAGSWPGKASTCRRMARSPNGRGAAWTSSSSRCTGLGCAARETAEEVGTLQATLENERKNLATATDATFKVPAGMTIWSTAASNGISVRAASGSSPGRLLQAAGRRAGDRYDGRPGRPRRPRRGPAGGEDRAHPAVVVMSRGSSSRLGKNELASITEGRVGRAFSWTRGITARSRLARSTPRLRALPN